MGDAISRSEFDALATRTLDAFDYGAAARVYAALGWRWAGVGVPNADAVRSTAQHLVESVRERMVEGSFSSSGGLTVTLTYGDDSWHLSLELCAVSATAYQGRIHDDAHVITSPRRNLPEVTRG